MPHEIEGRVSELTDEEGATLRAAANILDRLHKALRGVLYEDGQHYFGLDECADKLREMAG